MELLRKKCPNTPKLCTTSKKVFFGYLRHRPLIINGDQMPQSIHLSVYLSIYLPTYLPTYLSIYLSIIYLSIHPSTHLYTYTYLYIYTYIHIRIRLDYTKTAPYCYFINSKAKKLTKIH